MGLFNRGGVEQPWFEARVQEEAAQRQSVRVTGGMLAILAGAVGLVPPREALNVLEQLRVENAISPEHATYFEGLLLNPHQ